MSGHEQDVRIAEKLDRLEGAVRPRLDREGEIERSALDAGEERS